MIFLLVLANLVGSWLLVWVVNHQSLKAWRRAAGAHWTERARLVWPARVAAATNLFLVPVLMLFLTVLLCREVEFFRWVFVSAAIIGTFLGSYPLDRALFPQLKFKDWLHQAVVHWGMRIGMLLVLVAAGFLMPTETGVRMLAVAVAYLAIHVALQWGLFLEYLRLVGLLKPADDRLKEIVSKAASRSQARLRNVWLLESVMALAYALPTTGELIFSRRLLEIASDDEVASIAAHELAHLAESKAVLVLRFVGSLALFPFIFLRPLYAWLGTIGTVIPLFMMLSISLVSRKLSLRMEQKADAAAVKDQEAEGLYARALEKLYRENHLPAVNPSDRMTHPHLYDRMLAAGITPDYPRPRKPQRYSAINFLMFVLVGVLLGLLISRD